MQGHATSAGWDGMCAAKSNLCTRKRNASKKKKEMFDILGKKEPGEVYASGSQEIILHIILLKTITLGLNADI